MSVFQQTVLAAETHLAEGLALKLRRAGKVEKSLIDIIIIIINYKNLSIEIQRCGT
jgi:hypothetical protein